MSVRFLNAALTVLLVLALFLSSDVSSGWAAEPLLVLGALKNLVNSHVDKPDPSRLLSAGVEGLRQALAQAGISAQLEDLNTTREGLAETRFSTRFEQAAALARGKLSETDLQYAAVKAMIASLKDVGTYFLTPQEYLEATRRYQGEPSYVGIGVRFAIKHGRIHIWHPSPGSPAARAGLQDFDRVLAVDGRGTQGMNFEDLLRRVRGPQGTVVELRVQRAGSTAPLTFSIAREPINLTDIEFRMLDSRIGYVRIFRYASGTGSRGRDAVQQLVKQGARGLALDLRQGGGDHLEEMKPIADTLLPGGVLLYTLQQRQSKTPYLTDGGAVLPQTIAVAAILDEETEAASELLSAAIQDHQRGKLVGVRTSGRQHGGPYFSLGEAGMRVRTFRLTTGKGIDLEKKGVQPDFVQDLTPADLDHAVDVQLRLAVQVLTQGIR